MSNTEEKVGPGKFVGFTYKLYDEKTGMLLFEATKEAPDTLVYGVTEGVLPGLQNAMDGLKPGDRFSLTLPPEAAFGEKSEDYILTLPIATFHRDGKVADEVKVGAVLPMMTEDGHTVTGRVIEMTPEEVKMDFNHPFAGITVKFEGEVGEVRDATEADLHPKHGCCGGHCGGGSCGDDCGCDEGGCGCGDDCGCTDDDHCGCKNQG